MTRRLLAVAAVCLAAGCASAPTRPALPSTHGQAVSPARLFAGCTLKEAAPNGWGVRCGEHGVAIVHRGSGLIPAERRRALLVDSLKDVPSVVISDRRTISLPLAGAPRQVLVFTYEAKTAAAPRQLTALLTTFDLPSHRDLTLSCGGFEGSGVERCSRVMAYLAAHPVTPPKALRAGPDTTWPPARDLARLKGCRVVDRGYSMIRMTCGGAQLGVVRLPPARSPDRGRAALAAAGKGFLSKMKEQGLTSATLDEVPCEISGTATTCDRVDASGVGGKAEVLLGLGEAFGQSAMLVCIARSTARTNPHGCPPLLVREGGGAKTAVTPPPKPRSGKH